MIYSNAENRDKLQRRSRYRRQPTGKRIALTGRDFNVLRLLYRYRYLRSDRILDWFQPCSKKRLIERLGDLYHERFLINRVHSQWDQLNSGMKPLAYELTKNGLDALLERSNNLLLPDVAVSHAGVKPQQIRQFHHALEISHVIFDIELSLRNSLNKRLLFQTEILERAAAKLGQDIVVPKLPVTLQSCPYMPRQKAPFSTAAIPDALFAVETATENKRAYRFYALEVELKSPLIRRTPDKSSTLKKLLAYQQVLKHDIARKRFSFPNLYVIFASETEEKLMAIKELAEQIWSVEEQKRLLFKPAECHGEGRSELNQKWKEHF